METQLPILTAYKIRQIRKLFASDSEASLQAKQDGFDSNVKHFATRANAIGQVMNIIGIDPYEDER